VFDGIVAFLFVFFLNRNFENPVVLLPGGPVTILSRGTVRHTHEYFVYEYRGLRRKRRVHRKIASMETRAGGRETERVLYQRSGRHTRTGRAGIGPR
jgi:hypothetical protein